jgi:Tfp pilus assembly protein PilF
MDKPSGKYWTFCIYLALALATLAVFWQVRNYDFVGYDDPDYVSNNQYVKTGLTRNSITWAFTTSHASNWHPMTWLSHMLDCRLFGTEPGWHHLTNLLLHLANTLLLFGLLNRMTGALWRSAFVAAAFALHPLHVESVAWIAERKDVLSTFFWMLTMAAYLRYVNRPGVSRYLLTLVTFALGLMAKPMLVTLPFVLLLLDYWPLGRFQKGQPTKDTRRPRRKTLRTPSQWHVFYHLIREKIPFFALAALSSVVTFIVQQKFAAVATTRQFPLTGRIANAFISYLAYIRKMIWPSRLAMFYPYPHRTNLMGQAIVSALLLIFISIVIIWMARRRRYLLTGWLWYLGTLVPVIGLVQVGDQALADRYSYIPLTGLFIIIAWGLPDLLAKWRFRKIALAVSAIAVLSALSIRTYIQQGYWRNTTTLCEHALKVTQGNYVAHYCLAADFLHRGQIDQIEQAVNHYHQTLQIKPNYFKALGGLAEAFARQGRTDQAVKYYNEALRLEPDGFFSLNNLAWLRATHSQAEFRNPKQAVRLAERASKLTGYKNPTVLDTLAAAYAADGNFPQAIATAEKAVKLADSLGQKDLSQEIHDRLLLYKADQPYIQP